MISVSDLCKMMVETFNPLNWPEGLPESKKFATRFWVKSSVNAPARSTAGTYADAVRASVVSVNIEGRFQSALAWTMAS